jgi:hypothetical protein
MKFDSATTANTVTLLGATPSFGLIVLVIALGVFSVILFGMKVGFFNALGKFYLDLKGNNEATVRTVQIVEAIRKDQLVSNNAREELAEEVKKLTGEVESIKERINKVGCANAQECITRVLL